MTATIRPLRRVDTPAAAKLSGLSMIFEQLQTVLRCCERLVSELAAGVANTDELVVESLWTTAMLSYGRCFSAEKDPLTERDVAANVPNEQVLAWHQALVQLGVRLTSATSDPSEQFLVGVTRGEDGRPTGIAITSGRRPLVDDVTVRQTGAIAFALAKVVDDKIKATQHVVFAEVKKMTNAQPNAARRIQMVTDR